MWKLGFQQIFKTSQRSVIWKTKVCLLQQHWYDNDDKKDDSGNNDEDSGDLFFEGYSDDCGKDEESTNKIS